MAMMMTVAATTKRVTAVATATMTMMMTTTTMGILRILHRRNYGTTIIAAATLSRWG